MLEVGHIITSEINGTFETRTLGMRRWDGPSAQVYAWDRGSKLESNWRQLYVALSDNQDAGNYEGQTVDIGTPEVRVDLKAGGATASLTCRML